ncbi:MAG: aa3-type cytochrome c oxidase subunit IV [Pseudomonadota bacterium]
MESAEYARGEMDIAEQQRTWDGFMKASVWGSAIVSMVLMYTVLAIPLGINWFVSLVLTAGAGIVGGLAVNMGGAWIVTVIGLSGIAVLVQLIITVSKAMIPG